MNYAESFEQFSSKLSGMDLLLYAGAGIIIYVLFQDKLQPITNFIKQTLANKKFDIKNVVNTSTAPITTKSSDSLFFELISSWKKTRDLAVQNNCSEAVKVADSMFPYLSPSGCAQNGEKIS